MDELDNYDSITKSNHKRVPMSLFSNKDKIDQKSEVYTGGINAKDN